MKFHPAHSSLAARMHRPMRFGRRWRGHELALRIVQLIVIAFVAVLGAQCIAHGVAMLGQMLAGGAS
jgi:hypothetical protein